jgi:hypothetical protein
MHRRQLLAMASACAATGLPACAGPSAAAPQAARTHWDIRLSEGFDALAFLGPLSGKDFYTRYYRAELAAFAPRLGPPALAALADLNRDADAAGSLLWPWLTLVFSGSRTDSLADLLASLDAAEVALLPPFKASAYWDEDDWRRFMASRTRLATVLNGLRDADFGAFRAGLIGTAATQRLASLRKLLSGLDVISEQERLLGRSLGREIQLNLLWFCKPHGVLVQGQCFLAHVESPDDVMVLTAAHEVLHPPFDMTGPAARACLEVLQRDDLFTRILAEKNPDTGYNSLVGILEEDTVQALDQIIQERLGYGRAPAVRWRDSDEGMHVLAAGLYGLLKADGFDRHGGAIERWMHDAATQGRLAPSTLHAAAAAVLGRPVERLWSGKGGKTAG